MPGPPPKHPSQRRRTNPTIAMTRLPRSGRPGEPPAWPLGRQSIREADIWARIWRTPQAVAWEQLGWVDTVARYARIAALAERPKATVAALSEARQLEDRLGLNPLALLRLRWEVVDEEVAEIDAEPNDDWDGLRLVN